jgi:hypothetical protein
VELGQPSVTLPEREVGISGTGGLIVVLVGDGAAVHAYSADGGAPLWVHKNPHRLMGPTAPLVSRDGTAVAFKLFETLVVLNGSDGGVELVGQTGDLSGAQQSMMELACCCVWRRHKALRASFVGTPTLDEAEWARGRADGSMALPADGSAVVVKSRDNVLCFNVPNAYRANRRR